MLEQTYKEITGQTAGDLIKEYEDVKRRIDIYYGTLESRLENYEGTGDVKAARGILDAMRNLEFGSKEWKTLWCVSNDILAK